MRTLNPRLSVGLVDFAELLNRRLRASIFTTEDTVRYTFFAALTNALHVSPENVILEQPHPTISGARIDTWIVIPDERTIALEFKYDRPIPSQHHAPRTQKAGHLIKDLFRLAQLDPAVVEAVFVYVATEEMAKYLGNSKNGLEDFYQLPVGHTLLINDRYLSARAETLRGATGRAVPCVIECILSRNLADGHELRAYAVQPTT